MSLLKHCASILFVLFCVASSRAQQKLDLGITFDTSRLLNVADSQNFWMKGGSLELGINAWRGFGFAANVTGTHTDSIGNSGIPLSLVTATFGPRYRWHAGRKLSLYGESLIGEADGFYSLFPTRYTAQSSANGLATQLGVGADITVGHHFSIRAMHAAWQRTQLPNGTNNVQNNLQLGAGVVIRFGH